MPIISLKQVKKMTKVCGATIPADLLAKLEKNEKIGIEYAITQCRELLERGVPGIHFFVMNQAGPITQILSQLKTF
jgi:methylenetetrahydrofolate reductase (NADPH)